MTILTEVTQENYLQLPYIAQEELQRLWSFWDGSIYGILLYKGQKYWFEQWYDSADYGDPPFYRRFLIIELTDEQIAEEEYWIQLYREKVDGYKKPPELWSEYYNAVNKRAPRNFANNRVIGWEEVAVKMDPEAEL